jgi:FAD/FMN-containing dehydrogenase
VYRDFASTLKKINKNVFLIEGEYIWDVLNICDIVLQRCSTVAVEAWLLSKQTVEIELMPSLEHFLQPRYKSGSWVVKTGKELLDTVQKILCKPEYIPKVMLDARKKLLGQIIHRPDGKATERVAYELDRLSGDASKIDGRISYFTMRNWIKSLMRRTLGMKGYDYAANLSRFKIGDYLGRYDKSFTARDEAYWERKLARFVAKK